MTVSLHRSAERDLADAFRFCKHEAGRGVAGPFLNEFERVLALLQEVPSPGTPTVGQRRVYPMSGFPYSVIYRPLDGHVRVLVVRHQSRDPGFGADRS